MNILKSTQFWLWLVPFLIWMFFFRFFLSGQSEFVSDAVSYYEHIGIFTDQLAKGHYQLWDPFWSDGAPYHFFLRRIGEFNPFYLIIVLLKLLGFSHPTAYIFFLVIYYALGVAGFYLLTRFILKDAYVAYLGYCILLFSSLGTQLFYNYIILLFVPLVWFFYFLLRFVRDFRSYQWVGLCFCLGLIVTTYIPFYFLTLFSLFLILMASFYSKECWQICLRSWQFFKQHRLLVVATIIFLALAVLPGYWLYLESKAGDFVMPMRGAGSEVSSAVAVSLDKAASGDFINNSSFDKYFGHLDNMQLGDFYIPYIFIFFMVIAAFAKLNRLIVSVFIMIGFLLLLTITRSSFLHEFLFKHVFFFKFIRNIYYFFWLAILPLTVFWVCACLTSLLKNVEHKWPQSQMVQRFKKGITLVTILFIVGQSYIVYHDLTLNMKQTVIPLTFTKANYENHKYGNTAAVLGDDSTIEGNFKKIQSNNLYYSSRWYADIYQNIDMRILFKFAAFPIRLYDNTRMINTSNDQFWKTLEKSMKNEENVAYIFNASLDDEKQLNPNNQHVDIVLRNDPRVVWKKFGPNNVHLSVTLSSPKFLVFNNNFHARWHVTLNNKPARLIRSNYTYQGVWLPAGKTEVHFDFDKPFVYAGHWFYLVLFNACLGLLVTLWIRRL